MAAAVSDVFNGAMWRELLDKNGIPFTEKPRSLAVTINADWYSPFSGTYTQHNSVGAIYLSIDNLPRHVRFLPCNVIFLGCIPGSKEPKTSEMNNYLKLVVDELLPLYEGVEMVTYSSKGKLRKVRVALLKVAADTPASRKCIGFLSCRSEYFCIQCHIQYKQLPSFGTFPKRSRSENLFFAEKWKACKTQSERNGVEKEGGSRYSELHRLPYWNAMRQSPNDPFHVLLLGVCKKMIEAWKIKDYFSNESYKNMQEKVETINLPPGFESLGNSVGSAFSFMTGGRILTWLFIASPYVLKSVLPSDDYDNWMVFVDSCRLLIRPSITLEDADEAHNGFIKFGKKCVRLYGGDFIVPNFHFTTHFKEFVYDFGPVYSFWCLAYERYNNLLKNINVNGKDSFEVTMLTTFIKRKNAAPLIDVMSDALQYDVTLTPEHAEFLHRIAGYTRELGRLNHDVSQKELKEFYRLSSVDHDQAEVTGAEYIPLYNRKEGKSVIMNSEHYQFFLGFYENVAYKDTFNSCKFESCLTITVTSEVTIAGQIYRSARSSSSSGSFISAPFQQSTSEGNALYPGNIQYFFEHTPKIDGVEKKHVFCFVRWLSNDVNNQQPFIDSGLTFWSVDFERSNELCILPVHKINSHVATVKFVPKTKKTRGRPSTKAKMLVISLEKKHFL